MCIDARKMAMILSVTVNNTEEMSQGADGMTL
jgi:hypothetical protein